ncbi:MAG: ABC transporter cobalamide binding protein [Ignavibacteria bacterium]|nr:MAG: ABC transporter cobalamide binding protein [Ignavibacteria bacterium]KAF0161663.1 MAG: ABC transporter cobalamide binding protein [Ignavibacteria bacterium]
MRYQFLVYISILVFISCSDSENKSAGSKVITDDLGNSFTFDKVPQRIISLAPSLTEMFYSLELEKHLVGNTMYCYYPKEAQKIEKVGDMLTFNFERIVSLKPDLIFITVEGNTKSAFDKFRDLGLNVFVSNPRNYDGIRKTYSDLGKIFAITEKSEKSLAAWDSTLNTIRTTRFGKNKTAMFLIELRPIMLAGNNTFINEYLQFSGLKNIASDSKLNYPIFSREEVLKRNPEYIIYPTGGEDTVEMLKQAYPEWKNLKAIKNNNVIFIDRDLYLRPGPRFIEALADLSNRLHRKEEAAQNLSK